MCACVQVVENKFRSQFGEQREFVTRAHGLTDKHDDDTSDDDEWQPELIDGAS